MIKIREFFLALFLLSNMLYAGSLETLGSLTFHLDQLANADKINESACIPFTPEQEEDLWASVLHEEPELKKAYAEFIEARNRHDANLYSNVFQTLLARWIKLKDIKKGDNFVVCGKITYNEFETNPYISFEARNLIRPYVMPSNHPMRSAMDTIFLPTRVVLDQDAFSHAGFDVLFIQPRSYIVVGRHPLLPDYLIKANLDKTRKEKNGVPAWKWFVNRCVGAEQVRQTIDECQIKTCVVPQKFIYPLPPEPSPPDTGDYLRKIVVLLVDDMHLVDRETNRRYWKTEITKKHLNDLYTIISRANGNSYRADNIPFTVDKKIAFIDTEYPTAKPDYGTLRKYLSSDMRKYWDKIVSNGGPK